MTSKTYVWLPSIGGTWSLASNWNDITDGLNPSPAAPGAQDSVTVSGPSGPLIQTVTGPGAAAAAMFAGNTHLAGSFAFGALTAGAGGAGGLLEVLSGDSLTAGSLTLASGSLLGGGGTIGVSGTLAIGAASGAAATLYATGGGHVRSSALFMNAAASAIAIDLTASVEVGTLGTAVAGALSIDAGAALTGQGNANAFGAVIDNGMITAQGGTLTVGNVSGAGTLAIAGGATLKLNGQTGAGVSVRFAGPSASLAIATAFDAPLGLITGFAAGEVIDMLGSPITSAVYTAASGGRGVLTLKYGGLTAVTMTLAGNYTGDIFVPTSDGRGGTDITVSPAVVSTGGPSPGTATRDSYVWTSAAAGAWNVAANWRDVTAGAGPAAIAPGVNDVVAITGGQNDFLFIAGPGNAAALSIAGDLALSGAINTGSLTIGNASGPIVGALDLTAGAVLRAQSASVADGGIVVSGQGASLVVAGTLVLGGGPSGVGLPTASLSASEGGAVVLAGLTLGGGAGASVVTDPVSSIVIGTGAGTAGAVTVSAGASITGNGTIDPFGTVLDNGLITASGIGSTLTLGSASGTGSLAIAAGASLELLSPTSLPIAFAAASGTLVPTLTLGSEQALPTGTLTGFLPGDVIDVLGSQVTGVTVARGASTSIVTLLYGTTVIGRLTMDGAFTHQNFVAVSDGAGGTDILLVQQSGQGGGGGTGTTDVLAWAAPVSGAWGRASNWNDLTTGEIATLPPGAANAVVIAGPSGSNVQAIGGPGASSSLLLTGNTLLNGSFTANTLGIGTLGDGSFAASSVALIAGSTLAIASTAALGGGALDLSGAGALLSVGGTLTVAGAGDALLSAGSQATIQLGGLVLQAALGEAVVSVDNSSIFEVGAAGGAAAGVLTVDQGYAVSGAGSLAADGAIVDNGSIAAAGGTLTIGAFSGTGTLGIGTEATLALAAAAPGGATCQIQFQGGGATLELAGTAQALPSLIAGFAPGDAIVTANAQVTSVSWSQGTGHGTLTLFYGAQAASTLLLAGDYGGDVFFVQPDGAGSEITVAPSAGGTGTPPPGTVSPDIYVWTGQSDAAWANAANWIDQSASQTPALVAPGLHDLVSITGTTGAGNTLVQGPGNAASLRLQGNLALAGHYNVGTLAAGSGLLAVGSGSEIDAANASTAGAIAAAGGTFTVAGTLSLSGGVLSASAQATIAADVLVLAAGAGVFADASSSIEVGGGAIGGTAGGITIDPDGTISGSGTLVAAGQIIDDGVITAAGGALSLGAVSGTGTLLIGQGAELDLAGPAGSGLIIDFAANGILSTSVTPAAAIMGFGESDTILLPFSGATAAAYAPTGPGAGRLTITGGGGTLGVLTLLGIDAGSTFSVVASPGGGTQLSTTSGQNGLGDGGSGMSGKTTTYGGQVWNTNDFIASLQEPLVVQQALNQALAGLTSYVWTSDGTSWGAPEFGYANVAVAADPRPFTFAVMPYGYHVLIASGANPVYLSDNTIGNCLLVGNAGNDQLVGAGQNDTLIGGVGSHSILWAAGNATMIGGGSDTFVSNNGDVSVTTSVHGRSAVWLGAGAATVTLNGNDTVVGTSATNGGNAEYVTAAGDASTGVLAVGPAGPNTMFFTGGAGRDTVVAHAGFMVATGGSADNNFIIGAAGDLEYLGGTGSALVVGVAGDMLIQGGTGAMTVFGGTGTGDYSAQAGNSYFVVGDGASTVSASSGNVVWLVGGANVTTRVNGGGVIAWGANSTGNNVFQAGSGPATLVGGMGNDLFVAGSGNATLDGGTGNDAYAFTNGAAGGHDMLRHFVPGTDEIALHGYGQSVSALLAAATVSGGSTTLLLGDGTHITIDGVTGLTAASFVLS